MCGPLHFIDSATPEKGSPVLKVAVRMSPALAPSGFLGSNNRALAPVGSSKDCCC